MVIGEKLCQFSHARTLSHDNFPSPRAERKVIPKSSHRREQITEAALDLLADTPVDALRTRQIARHVGVSQPALFRHFRTRDAILEAVVDLMRQRLEAAVVTLLEETEAPLDRARGLVRLLFEHGERYPGLIRLVLAESVPDDGSAYHQGLAHLLAMQRSFFTTFVRRARERGDVTHEVDPNVAAQLILALVQGTLLSWVRGGRQEPLGPWGARVSNTWEAGLGLVRGVGAAAPGGTSEAENGELASVVQVQDRLRQVTLDVRPILKTGVDPLDAILAALAKLSPGGLAVVRAPFAPRPLRALLVEEGYQATIEDLGDAEFQLVVLGRTAPALVDLSDLEAPLPLEHVLEAAATLDVNAAAHFRLPRVPKLLLPRLAERGIEHEVTEQGDGRGLLTIWRPR